MDDTSGGFTNLKKRNSGFTLIEIMIVIAVAGILAVVAIPKYQGLIDHYHLESSAQIVAGQLRNAKQYAMDRRTDYVYVMFNSTSVQMFYVDANYKYSPLEGQQSFDSGITFVQEDSQGLVNIPSSVDIDHISYELHDIPQNFDKCLNFKRKGFLSVNSVDIVLTNGRTPSQSVMVSLTSASLAVKITWL